MRTVKSKTSYKLILIILFLFSISAMGQDTCINNVEAMPLKMVDTAPVYPGCENSHKNEDVINCLDEKIKTFFAENIRVAEGRSERFIIQMKIDENGCIKKVRVHAKTSAIEKEALRVSALLPQIKSGRHQGENIDVLYSLILSLDE